MAFRADEAAEAGYARVKKYLLPKHLSHEQREQGEKLLLEIMDRLGPAVDCYPSWHPIVAKHDPKMPETYPNERCGYKGLDHTVLFAHGFITCPYASGERVIESVEQLDWLDCAHFSAESIDFPFYNNGTAPVVVSCDWQEPLDNGKLIPKSLAVPLMIEKELPLWNYATVAENWYTMRPYLLGEPNGARSSLFVSQETALALKKVYMAMVESGMFGPLRM